MRIAVGRKRSLHCASPRENSRRFLDAPAPEPVAPAAEAPAAAESMETASAAPAAPEAEKAAE